MAILFMKEALGYREYPLQIHCQWDEQQDSPYGGHVGTFPRKDGKRGALNVAHTLAAVISSNDYKRSPQNREDNECNWCRKQQRVDPIQYAAMSRKHSP
jgi:hypothetical protein